MSCADTAALIPAMLDGELAVADIVQLERHLAECDGCRSVHATEAWLHGVLAAGSLADEPPDRLRQRIHHGIAAEAASAPDDRALGWRRPRAPALAAVLGALALLFLPGGAGGPGVGEPQLLIDAAARHRQYAATPPSALDVAAADAARLEAWIRARLGLKVRLPERAGRGEALVGGRVATVAAHPAVQVLYSGEGRRISLFVVRKPPSGLPEEVEHLVGGVEVYTTSVGAESLGWWEDGRQLYVAVSSVGHDDLLAFAERCVEAWSRAIHPRSQDRRTR